MPSQIPKQVKKTSVMAPTFCGQFYVVGHHKVYVTQENLLHKICQEFL